MTHSSGGRSAVGSTLTGFIARRGRIVAAVAGAALPLAYAPFGIYVIAPLVVAVFYACLDGVTAREAARRGFLFGFASFLAGTYWVYISLHVFGKAPLYLSLPLMLAMIAFLAGYVALTAWAGVRLAPVSGALRWLVVLPALWTLTEWLRGWLLSGFGWLALGYSQTDSALAGYAPVAGLLAVSWTVALSAGALRLLATAAVRPRALAALLIAAIWSGGWALDRVRWWAPAGEPLDVRVVQGAVPQDRKWLPEELQPTMALYAKLTARHLDADLIIWPEAAIPTVRHRIAAYYDSLGAMAAEAGSRLLVGAIEYREDTGQFLNGVFVAGDDNARYYKRHLVPFGEYFPVPAFVRRWMRLMSLPYSDYDAGPAQQPPIAVAGQRLAVSVCYEDVFGEELIYALREATLMVNVSNDAWFGDSIAPHQHLQIARMRAIEGARPMIRATNTGISALIGPDGEVASVSPQFETHVLAGLVQPTTGLTLYARVGNWLIVTGCLTLLVGAVVLSGRRQGR